MKTEDVFEIGGEGGGLCITRQLGKPETIFIYKHNEFDPTDEGLDVNEKYVFSNFEEPFELINGYPWHMLHILKVHDDYRTYISEKLIEKLNSESVKPDHYFERRKYDIEQILKIKLKHEIIIGGKSKWSFSQLNNQ